MTHTIPSLASVQGNLVMNTVGGGFVNPVRKMDPGGIHPVGSLTPTKLPCLIMALACSMP